MISQRMTFDRASQTCAEPLVEQHNNEAADAEALCEAARRLGMRFVVAKSADRRRTQYCSGCAARAFGGARGRGDDVGNADLE